MSGAYLGYQDGVFAALAFLGLLLAIESWVFLAGVVWMLAIMYKQLALMYLPALIAALFLISGWRGITRNLLAMSLTALLIVSPILIHGRALGMLYHLATWSIHSALSANAANVWWLVTFLGETSTQVTGGARVLAALNHETRVTTEYANVARLIGLTAYGAFTVANVLVLLRRRTTTDMLVAVAMQMYGYYMLMIGVHENHGIGIPIFLALFSSWPGRLRRLYVLVSLVVFLNLALFYNPLGMFGLHVARLATWVDTTVLAAVLNVGVFVWACALVLGNQYQVREPKVGIQTACPG